MSSTLDFDSREFEKRMKIYGEKAESTIIRLMSQNARDLERKAKDTCPVLEGTLQGDIMATKAERVSDGYEAYVWGGTGESRPYALRQHEELKPAGSSVPGPVTVKRPNTPWGPAGGKYLTRPLMHMLNEYQARVAKALDAIK